MMMSAMMMMTMMMSAMMIMVRTVGHNLHSAKLWLHSSRTWWWWWWSLQWWWETRSSLQGRCSLWLNDHDDWSGDTMAFGTMARELLSLKGTSSTPLEAGQVKLYWQGILWIIQLSLSNAFNFSKLYSSFGFIERFVRPIQLQLMMKGFGFDILIFLQVVL